MSVDLPEVPEDAPPAVLFRLSYRTDNTARGGYRDSDSEARVVDAMRGWWELNPEDIQALNIKYAVAFHDGVTRAVAEIGEWKWAELPSGVHLGLEVSDPGRPIIDDAWKSARRPRWAFELKSRRPAVDRRYPRDGGPPDYVRQAWFGERGQTMPPRLRDTAGEPVACLAIRPALGT